MGAPYIYDISRLRVKDLHSATYIYVVRRLRVIGQKGLVLRPRCIETERARTQLPIYTLYQCFSTAGPRPGTGPWHQLFRAARGSPGSCHFSFLSIFSWINLL